MKYKQGDTVKIRVDSEKRTIAFAVNEGAFQILAIIDASEDPYFLAVWLYYKEDEVFLVRWYSDVLVVGYIRVNGCEEIIPVDVVNVLQSFF